jgi:hypothetical protein
LDTSEAVEWQCMSTLVFAGAMPACTFEPCASTRVVELSISIPLGLFSYTKRFSLQMGNFVTSQGLSCETGVKRAQL